MAVKANLAPQLIKPSEAAELLQVDVRTILKWIDRGAIPYVELPSGDRPSYRIPLQGLLNSLSGNYDLAEELEHLFGDGEADGDAAASGKA